MNIFRFDTKYVVLTLMVWSLLSPWTAAQNPLAKPCSTCHGSNGQSLNPLWPHLAGQEPHYFKKQIQDLKQGKTRIPDPQMLTFVNALNDAEIEILAQYYAQQKRPVGRYKFRRQTQSGKALYQAGNPQKGIISCSVCHGIDGIGNGAPGIPSLKAQGIEYIVKQLKAFKSYERHNDQSELMNRITSQMTDDEMYALGRYIASF